MDYRILMYNVKIDKGVVIMNLKDNDLLESVYGDENEISVKCHLYFKMLKGETEEDARNRICDYLNDLSNNRNCPFEYQIHEMEKNEV